MKTLFNKNQGTSQSNALDALKSKIQIEMLKEQLTQSDYQVIKCQECALAGIELPYDMTVLHKERQSIRDKINELQNRI